MYYKALLLLFTLFWLASCSDSATSSEEEPTEAQYIVYAKRVSPHDLFNFNLFLYNLNDGKNTLLVENVGYVTNIKWALNDSLFYYSYSSQEDSLFLLEFNINKKQRRIVWAKGNHSGSTIKSINFSINGNILFEVFSSRFTESYIIRNGESVAEKLRFSVKNASYWENKIFTSRSGIGIYTIDDETFQEKSVVNNIYYLGKYAISSEQKKVYYQVRNPDHIGEYVFYECDFNGGNIKQIYKSQNTHTSKLLLTSKNRLTLVQESATIVNINLDDYTISKMKHSSYLFLSRTRLAYDNSKLLLLGYINDKDRKILFSDPDGSNIKTAVHLKNEEIFYDISPNINLIK